MKAIEITAIWCPSCLVMRPIYEKIYEKYRQQELFYYNICKIIDEI